MDDLSELIREYVNLSDTIADYEARPQNNMGNFFLSTFKVRY